MRRPPRTGRPETGLAGLVGEIVLDARAGEMMTPMGMTREHLIVAREWSGLGVARPVVHQRPGARTPD